MPQAAKQKDFFQLNKGLNTESNEISFPDGYTVDERNYELLPDGSRRRRKGLALESGGSAYTVPTITTSQVQQCYKWKNVGGDPTKTFIVHQIGDLLFITDDAEIISTTFRADGIELEAMSAGSTVTATQIANEPVQFTDGRGHLFVTSRYINPSYIEYDPVADAFTVNKITLTIRDFLGKDDDIVMAAKPTALTDDHTYNLRNRGWTTGTLNSYYTGTSSTNYPAKNMIWYKGLRRLYNASYFDADGIQEWSSAKLDAEAFASDSSAPQGSLLINPLDTTYSASTGEEGYDIDNWVVTGSTGVDPWTITITVAAGSRPTVGDYVTISGQVSKWVTISGFLSLTTVTGTILDGTHEVLTTPSSTTFTIEVPRPALWVAWNTQYLAYGAIDGGDPIVSSGGQKYDSAPSSCAFYASRMWYAGVPESEWADNIFFSQLAQKDSAYGWCHQKNDPTSPYFNSLEPTDGGVIIIPKMGKVLKMLPMRDVLLVFTTQGVWEIGGNGRAPFMADNYSVRKLTDAECSSPYSPIVVEAAAYYTGPKGIFAISPNQYTGLLEVQNISAPLIQTLWNSIPAARQAVVRTVYDDALRRIYLLYDTGEADALAYTSASNQYNTALVLDLRVGGWYKFVFNTSATDAILSAFAISDADSSVSNQKIKWVCQTAATEISICDLNQTSFTDFNGAESPTPYMVTGWDFLGDFQRRRQAPVITVFSKKTETGFTATGNGLDPVNESSCLMTAYWDWTDSSTSGKVGSTNETYRHVRAYQPTDVSDTFADGYPVVTTRNKVRGRGRVLQLKFEGASSKDTHLLGFSINYKISRGV